MKRNLWIVAAVCLMTALSLGVTYGEPPEPTVRFQSKFEVANPPTQFDQLQIVFEVPPGGASPRHTHGGEQYVTILNGELTRRVFGDTSSEKRYKAGDSYIEKLGEVHEVANTTNTKVTGLSTFLVPKSSPLTTIQQTGVTSQQLPPGPVNTFQARVEIANPPKQFDVVDIVQDFAPGAWTPLHSHGGQGVAMVIEGELTLRQAGVEKKLKAGDMFVAQAGEILQVGNTSSAKASMAIGFLLPKGAQLTTNAPSNLPQTGTANSVDLTIWLLLVGGSGLLAVTWIMRRTFRRA